MPKGPCRTLQIAESRVARIERCNHGTIHVHLGALSLRLSPEQLEELAEALSSASQALAPASETVPES